MTACVYSVFRSSTTVECTLRLIAESVLHYYTVSGNGTNNVLGITLTNTNVYL